MLRSLLKQLFRRTNAIALPAGAPAALTGAAWLPEVLQLQHLRRHREVAETVRGVLSRDPDNLDALQLLASAHFGLRDMAAGIDCLQRVVELQPESVEARLNLAAVLETTGDHAGAAVQ